MRYDNYRMDKRKRRADALAHAVLQEIGDMLQPDMRRDATRAIVDLLWRIGADIITDAERAEIGLPARDNLGWTAEELSIREAHLNMAACQMIPMASAPLFNANLGEKAAK